MSGPQLKRLATHMPMNVELRQVCNDLMDQEGLCTCGRVLKRIDPKLFLATGIPSKDRLAVGVYCFQCAGAIDDRLKALRKVMYTGVETAPVSYDYKDLIKTA